MTTEALTAPATVAAPAASVPAAAPPSTAAPATQAGSMFKPTEPAPGAAPAPSAPADGLAWLPAKFRVMDATGQIDMAASSKKLGEGYTNAEKRIGTTASAPESPDAYAFTPPEEFKDTPLDEGLAKSFRDRAHKAGLSQDQFQFVMGEYFGLVPALLDAKTAHTSESARAELSKVWKTSPELEAGMNAAERAVSMAPKDLQQAVKEKYGADPLFWQFAAHYGKQLREDTPPSSAPAAQTSSADALMASDAYRNPKHPEHVRVSAQVQQHFQARYGTAPAM